MIAGIDPDTNKVVVAEHGPEGWSFRIAAGKGRTAEHRFLPLVGEFRMLVNQLRGVSWVYIERPPMGRNVRATIDQSMVVGAIAAILHERGIPFSLVDPGTWKKVLIGRGDADKPLIKSWAIANLGLADGHSQDAYDAACIQRYGELVSGHWQGTPLADSGDARLLR